MVSLPIGAVRLTQTFVHSDPPRKNELEQMRGLIQREISRVQQRVIDAKVQMVIATSGTAAALSGLYSKRGDEDGVAKPVAVPQPAHFKNREGAEPAQPDSAAGAAGHRSQAR